LQLAPDGTPLHVFEIRGMQSITNIEVNDRGEVAVAGMMSLATLFGGIAAAPRQGSSSAYVALLEPDLSEVRWLKVFGDALHNVHSVALTREGDVLFSGSIRGPLDVGTGEVVRPSQEFQNFLARFHGDRGRALSMSLLPLPVDLALGPWGDLYLAGTFFGPLPSSELGPARDAEEGRGGLLLARVSQGSREAPARELRWARYLSGDGLSVGHLRTGACSRSLLLGMLRGQGDFGGGVTLDGGEGSLVAVMYAP
jgi:hypothetical protein